MRQKLALLFVWLGLTSIPIGGLLSGYYDDNSFFIWGVFGVMLCSCLVKSCNDDTGTGVGTFER